MEQEDRIAFRQILEQQVEETITDEQVQRVLAPVLERIRNGEFDRPRRRRRFVRTAYAAATLLVCLGLGIAFASGRPQAVPEADIQRQTAIVTIQDQPVPLAGPTDVNSLSGTAVLPGSETGCVLVRLVDAETGEVVAVMQTDESGQYAFEGFADGTYRVEAAMPNDGSTDDIEWKPVESELSY
jgi:hypothetical protein